MERKQGISLVALIITIIVLIILTGAVIITMNQGNTIEKSEEAVFKSDLTNFRDQLVMKILDKQAKMEITGKGDAILNNVTGNNLRTWVPSITDKYIDKLAIKEGNLYYTDTENEQEYGWAAEINMIDISSTLAGQVKVGDYIKYIPVVESYIATRDKTGHSADQTFTSTASEETWRVLSIEGTNVTIMREEPTANLALFGQVGYDNAEEVLNGICGIYKNEAYAKSARSITIEDINKVTGYTTVNIADTSSNAYTMIFGNYANKYYWVASRFVDVSFRIANLNVRCVSGGCVGMNSLCNEHGEIEEGYWRGVCPVVELKSTVSVTDGSGTVGDPWKIQ